MTTFAPATTPRYYHATIKRGVYGYELNEKPIALRATGLSQSLSNIVRGWATTGNFIVVYGRKIVDPLFVASSTRITPLFELGNNKAAQFRAGCVKIKFLSKNKRSHFSVKTLARSTKIEYTYGS